MLQSKRSIGQSKEALGLLHVMTACQRREATSEEGGRLSHSWEKGINLAMRALAYNLNALH